MKAPVAIVAMTTASVVLAACGSSSPKPEVVGGVTLTSPGTKLAFGKTASVADTVKPKPVNPIQITVTRVTQIATWRLARYGVATMKPAVTPYFVNLKVKNLGKTDLGGSDVPIYLQDSRNVLLSYTRIRGKFTDCPSQPLPKKLGTGATASLCLIYLLPQGDPATMVTYRPDQTKLGITWSGTIGKPTGAPKSVKKAKPAKKKKAKH